MITCPQCGAQNLPGLAYCENCGSPLPQSAPAATGAPAAAAPQSAPTSPTAGPTPADAAASAPPPPPQPDPVAAAMPQPVMPVDQPPPGPDMGVPAPTASGANVVAAEPGGATADTSTAAPPAGTAAPPAGTAAPPAGTPAPAPAAAAPAGATLSLTFPTGQVYTMEEDTVNVGRTDVAQNWHPELDVIPYGGGAPDLGVSRHQARLVRQDGGFVVIDMGSTNGTYVNGRAAPYNQTVPLQDGDTLSFGALNTQVSIK